MHITKRSQLHKLLRNGDVHSHRHPRPRRRDRPAPRRSLRASPAATRDGRRRSIGASPRAHHLLVEAGTGVGKSFAYLLPAIDFAVKNKKRVVISTHTISLQEQLIDKDIPLIQSGLSRRIHRRAGQGPSNYLCQRRLEQTRAAAELVSSSTTGSSNRSGRSRTGPRTPPMARWPISRRPRARRLGQSRRRARQLPGQKVQVLRELLLAGRQAPHAERQHPRRQSRAVLLRPRAAHGRRAIICPSMISVILDEAHTVEDVAGDHFGLKISEGGAPLSRFAISTTLKRGKGMLSTHGSMANDAIARHRRSRRPDRSNSSTAASPGTKSTAAAMAGCRSRTGSHNDLSPKLRDLHKHMKAMLAKLENEEEISELSRQANRVATHADALDAIIGHKLEDAVYWMEVTGRTPKESKPPRRPHRHRRGAAHAACSRRCTAWC